MGLQTEITAKIKELHQYYKMDAPDIEAKEIIAKMREVVEGAGLTDEEIEHIILTADETEEFEQMATIGLQPDEHLEYESRLRMLLDTRLQEKAAEAQTQAILKAMED